MHLIESTLCSALHSVDVPSGCIAQCRCTIYTMVHLHYAMHPCVESTLQNVNRHRIESTLCNAPSTPSTQYVSTQYVYTIYTIYTICLQHIVQMSTQYVCCRHMVQMSRHIVQTSCVDVCCRHIVQMSVQMSTQYVSTQYVYDIHKMSTTDVVDICLSQTYCVTTPSTQDVYYTICLHHLHNLHNMSTTYCVDIYTICLYTICLRHTQYVYNINRCLYTICLRHTQYVYNICLRHTQYVYNNLHNMSTTYCVDVSTQYVYDIHKMSTTSTTICRHRVDVVGLDKMSTTSTTIYTICLQHLQHDSIWGDFNQ